MKKNILNKYIVTSFFFVLIVTSMLMFSTSNVNATHTSKPIITVNRKAFTTNEAIPVTGWVEYVGHPVSDVLLDIMLREQNGTIIVREGLKSDPNGNFTTSLTLPKNLTSGKYSLYIISQCRDEHREICTNQDSTIPITINKVEANKNNILSSTDTPNSTINSHSNAYLFPHKSSSNSLTHTNYSSSNQSRSKTLCAGKFPNIVGTTSNDILLISGANNVVETYDGNDTIYVMDKGNNTICSGEGDDLIIDNSQGNDTIYGGLGKDIIDTVSIHNLIDGEDGNDILIDAGKGENIIYGSNGNDLIIDNSQGNDTIYGGLGKDIIYSGMGNNIIHGGFSNDTLFGGLGENALYGDEGYDTINGGAGRSIIDGGPGFDSCASSHTIYNCEEIKP
jgi:hemolysin type calcium-binding protein